MVIILPGPEPKQRALSSEEKNDHDIENALYVGVSWEGTGQVWKNEDGFVTCLGVPSLEPVRVSSIGNVADTLRSQTQPNVILHRMTLEPGQYYPRIARPTAPGFAPRDKQEMYGSVRHFLSLTKNLDEILDCVEPTIANFDCHGNRIRSLLLLTCTECENQMRGILRENGVVKYRYTTNDFVRLLEPMRLGEYSVEFSEMPWLSAFTPFVKWNAEKPTKSLRWYDDYNAAKHDRTENLHRASLKSVFEALAALWVLLSAQYGTNLWHTHSGSDHIFTCSTCPRWRYSEVYTYPYEGAGRIAEEVHLFPSG